MQLMSADDELKNGRKYLVGYVGVMGKQEGIDYLLKSIQYIVYTLKRSDIHFGLVGGGTELEMLVDYANILMVGDYVTFTGRISDKEMLKLLNTADVCVNPDVVNEMNDKSTMNKIMEYMALGKPIVQFEMTEGRVTAQEASLYAKANDEQDFAYKIIDLIENEEQRKQMGLFGRNRVVDKLAWKYEAPKLLAAYAKLFQANL